MWGKSLAAALLGFPLATALVGLAALLGPGDLGARALPLLLLFCPVWIGVMAAAFLFRDGKRAWLWMGACTLAGFGLLHWVKLAGLAELPA